MSVIVAARVRPFTQQEKQKNKGICVEMYNNDILLTNLKNKQEQHAYSLDRVFWSFDGSTMSEGRHVATQGSKYASQELIYDQLARPQVDNAFQGYHSCLFAYGPTGAGKSYTMVGKDKNIGMIGLAVEDIYKRIENDKSDTQYELQLSMMEVYNDKVHDLMKVFDVQTKLRENLEVLQEKHLGFYVRDLSKFAAGNIKEMKDYMQLGFDQRSIAATQINQQSSRAHTIVQIEIKQTNIIDGDVKIKLAYLNFVDLAGSETLKDDISSEEAQQNKYINESLSYLCNVLQAIRDKKQDIPYLTCSLTKILMNSLGGNSKTVMICALSPSECSYTQTMKTLEIAQVAMGVVNHPIKSEMQQTALINELDTEMRCKMKQLEDPNMAEETREEIEAEIQDKVNIKDELLTTFELKISTSQSKNFAMISKRFMNMLFQNEKTISPQLLAINEDDSLAPYRFDLIDGLILGSEQVGSGLVQGLGVEGRHVQFRLLNEQVTIEPCSLVACESTWINGEQLKGKRQLKDYDRITIGIYKFFVLELPVSTGIRPIVTYWKAEQEIRDKNSYNIKQWEEEQKALVYTILIDESIKDNKVYDTAFTTFSDSQTQKTPAIQLSKTTPVQKLQQPPQQQQPTHIIQPIQQLQPAQHIQPQQFSQQVQPTTQPKQQQEVEAEYVSKKSLKYAIKVEEANKMAKKLGVQISFLLNYQALTVDLGKNNIKKCVQLAVYVYQEDKEENYIWSKDKFNLKYEAIKTLYDQFQTGMKIYKQDNSNVFDDHPIGNEIATCVLPFTDGSNNQPLKLSNNLGFLSANINLQKVTKKDIEKLKYTITINNLKLNEHPNKESSYYVQYALLNQKGKIVNYQTTPVKYTGNSQLSINYALLDEKPLTNCQLVDYFKQGQINFRVFKYGSRREDMQQEQPKKQKEKSSCSIF